MKNLKTSLLALAAFSVIALVLPYAAEAQVYGASNSSGSVSGASIVGTGGTTETLPTTTDTLAGLGTSQTFTGTETFSSTTIFNNVPTFNSAISMQAAGINTFGSVFGNTLTANPITQTVFFSATATQANAGINILSSASGRTIVPTGAVTIMVSGTAATATSVVLECQPSHRIFVTWPIANLVDRIPVGIYASSTTVLGSALNNGCNASDSIQLSVNANNLATTTQLFINLPYVVQ